MSLVDDPTPTCEEAAATQAVGCPNTRDCESMTQGIPSSSPTANTIWAIAGRVAFLGCQWGIVAILAKLGSLEAVGKYALGLAICTPLLIFSRLHLRTVLATDAGRQFRFAQYLTLTVIATLVGLAVLTSIVGLCHYPFETRLIIIAVALRMAADSVSEIVYGLLQQHERLDLVATSTIIRSVVSLSGMVTVLLMTGSAVASLATVAAASIVTLLSYDLRLARSLLDGGGSLRHATHTRQPFDFAALFRLLGVALPLGFVTLLYSLNSNIPRYFIEHLLGDRALGIFAALASFMLLGDTLILGFNQAALPRLAKYHTLGQVQSFRALVLQLSIVAFVTAVSGMAGAYWFGDLAVALLFSARFTGHNEVLLLLMVAGGIGHFGAVYGTAVTAMRRFWLPLPVHGLCLAIVVTSARWQIERHELPGAAWLVILAAAVPAGIFAVAAFAASRARVANSVTQVS